MDTIKGPKAEKSDQDYAVLGVGIGTRSRGSGYNPHTGGAPGANKPNIFVAFCY